MGLPTDLPLVGWTRDPGPFSGKMRFLTLAQPTLLTVGKANQLSKIIGNSEEVDDDLTSCHASGIPSEACLPRETGMRSLRTGKNHIRWDGPRRRRRRQVHLNSLISHEMLTGTSMFSAAPISPEERRGTNGERMEQDAHLARLLRGAALPLALLAHRAGTTTADAGSIHHAQASIGFSA